MPRDDEQPQYTVYRSRPKLFGRRDEAPRDRAAAGMQELREDGSTPPNAPPKQAAAAPRAAKPRRRLNPFKRRPSVPGKGFIAGLTVGKVIKWVLLAAL